MINFKLIYKILGSLLLLEAMFILVCIGVSLFYHEDDIMAFSITLVLMFIGAIILRFMGRNASNNLGRRDAYLLVTLTWIIFSLFGSFPFSISGYIPNFTNAYFETISGFTTTGASVIDVVEVLPHGLLFWRSMTQWIGGLGIVFFTIAILPSMVGGTVKVFAAEATGPIRAKMHPRLSTNAKWIWSIYLTLTIGCAIMFYFGGMDLFDCMNYAMTITATGGFATHSESTGFYHSAFHYLHVSLGHQFHDALCHDFQGACQAVLQEHGTKALLRTSGYRHNGYHLFPAKIQRLHAGRRHQECTVPSGIIPDYYRCLQ